MNATTGSKRARSGLLLHENREPTVLSDFRYGRMWHTGIGKVRLRRISVLRPDHPSLHPWPQDSGDVTRQPLCHGLDPDRTRTSWCTLCASRAMRCDASEALALVAWQGNLVVFVVLAAAEAVRTYQVQGIYRGQQCEIGRSLQGQDVLRDYEYIRVHTP